MQLIIQLNGFTCLLIGSLMILPVAVERGSLRVFGLSALLALVIGAALVLAGAGGRRSIRTHEIFLLTTTVWLTAAAAGALPLALSGMTVIDAVFESMSGITTTGSTVLTGLDAMPRGLLLWRALLQWVGGLGIIVTAIAVLPIIRVGGMQVFRSESSERTDKELASAAQFAIATFWIYFLLTTLCAVVYRLGGMTDFDAVTHAMTTLSTGGFSTHDTSIAYFESPLIEWSATVFMLSGSLPFVWYLRIYTRGTLISEQVRHYLTGLGLVIATMAVGVAMLPGMPPADAVRHVAFNVVSVVTTTGFASTDYTRWGEVYVTAFFVLTFIGGCTGSTSGGIKAMRIVVMNKLVRRHIRAIHFPHVIGAARFEGAPVAVEVYSGVVGFMTAFTAVFAVTAILLNLMGLDLVTSVSGAATALANVGPGLGPTIGPAGNFASLPDEAKGLLAVAMLLGRLEVLTVLVLLLPSVWRIW